jgi:hypothetical protein
MSFPHPVQGVSPAALNALAIRHRYFVEPSQKQRPTSHFAHWEPKTGSLRILAASTILFKGRVRPLSVEDGSPQHPLNSRQKRFLSTSLTIIAAARCSLSPVTILSRGP